MKILLVEDELNVVSFIKRGLEEENHVVSVAMDGLSASEMLKQNVFDLVLLDIMLPGKSGIEICKELRQEGKTMPVIMLTALGSAENTVTGLDSGADDYIVKPFNFNELMARIRSVSRRANPRASDSRVLSLADLSVDIESKTVTRQGIPIQLTATEFRLLEYLLRNRRRVLSRVDILENVWDITFNLGTNVVDVYVNYLRKKVDKEFEPKLIHTVIGMGYVLKEAHENTN
ncbi:response regulator transcription factor [Parachryseolinea silvisoli]|jgi:DNA-binding response OmpR family regulator|uniref:response regulator transcription factor n=1 Tax=Parachryseolinea silvisoli TaxID=2873601 RepID=UPI00226592EA|nr:response regulator transcription factor [Parachryseolinea silvisoli]MCD9018225.1 response regulator transcription factor [Parachryseolinea silvisoli]